MFLENSEGKKKSPLAMVQPFVDWHKKIKNFSKSIYDLFGFWWYIKNDLAHFAIRLTLSFCKDCDFCHLEKNSTLLSCHHALPFRKRLEQVLHAFFFVLKNRQLFSSLRYLGYGSLGFNWCQQYERGSGGDNSPWPKKFENPCFQPHTIQSRLIL